mmetsp:Transcript_10881/g.19931  ORF Transcript_10881/g.19931 Transcript_10881/m.19931 type:complete len:198 (+) Transcript_10881:44-637(+)
MSVQELEKFMVRCRVSRHQLVSMLKDVEVLKTKLDGCNESLKQSKSENSELVNEETDIKKNMEALLRSHKHARSRLTIINDEIARTKQNIIKRNMQVRSLDQEYRVLVGMFHKLNDEHLQAQKDARDLFNELVKTKKERDKYCKSYEKNCKLVANRRVELASVKRSIESLKAALQSGMNINVSHVKLVRPKEPKKKI